MKNLRYFTFERNKYFYGKLLSVDDFECEQRYMNDKRRMINRFIHGTGVVCGMNVVPIDDMSISVEMGLALDFAGREIMLEQPIAKKLSTIDGFEEYTEKDEEDSCLYLCIEYDEKEKEPVHSIAGSKSSHEDGMEYNKYSEGYHLYLTSQEPEKEEVSVAALYQETNTVYWANGIRIRQTAPRYVQSDHEFELKISVENVGQKNPISFQYSLKANGIQGQDEIRVQFDETEYKKATHYEVTKKMKVSAVSDVIASLTVIPESFQLEIGGISTKSQAQGKNQIQIVSQNVKQEIMDRYYQTAMEDIVKNTYQQSIYLAKISIIRTVDTYMIDSVENMPFGQYLYNGILASAMNQISMQDVLADSTLSDGQGKYRQTGSFEEKDTDIQVSAGVETIELGMGAAVGQRFFSKEISHGLGLGKVNIVLGKACGLQDSSDILFGATDIFSQEPGVKIDMAAKVNVEKGTFSIGIRCLEGTLENQVKIHWIAMKDKKEYLREKQELILQIKPDMMEMSTRESYYFEALYDGKIQNRIRWRIREEDGGTIDANGLYTSPNKAGVYEIICESMDEPKMRASTFVVVREN